MNLRILKRFEKTFLEYKTSLLKGYIVVDVWKVRFMANPNAPQSQSQSGTGDVGMASDPSAISAI